jgi:tRNA A-37 threonylcarbamoyl transferase component Bud32
MIRGKKVGKYELGRTLGSGSFSKVKLGVDDTGKQYAVKMIEKEQLVREHMEEQLKREISVMKLLNNHPHIVRLYDVLQTSNHIYLVLELVTGGELFDRLLQAKKFEEDIARRYFQQIVVALHYCHRHGVAHRDLKPENLLVDDKDNIKITDFGLANVQGAAMLRTVCGTPNYVAPEVLREVGYNGLAADVWSCGVILYVMLAGYLPFDDHTLEDLFKKIQKGEFRMSKSFSDGARDIIARMLVVDPARRYSLDQVMKHPWFLKGFDRTVLDTMSRAPQQTAQVATSVDKLAGGVRKEETYQQPAPATGAVQLGAFELVSQLTMTTMATLTSTTPVVKINTRFVVGRDPEAALARLSEALEALKASPRRKEGELELRAFINKPKGLLAVAIALVPTVVPTLTIVEVRRSRGDTLDFHELYRTLLAELGADVRSRPSIAVPGSPGSPTGTPSPH